MNIYKFHLVFACCVFGLIASESSSEPPTNKYVGKFDENRICLLFQSAIRLQFNYTIGDNATQWVSNSTDIPKIGDLKYDVVCGHKNFQSLVIRFLNTWTLEFNFTVNETASKYALSSIWLNYILENGKPPFPNATSIKRKRVEIVVNDGWCDKYGSYVCTGRKTYPPLHNDSHPFVAMEMFNEQYNAFINSTTEEFTANVRRCTGDTISNLIPIVVGAALGGLIVIVLIAYIIGRHRSKKGYEYV